MKKFTITVLLLLPLFASATPQKNDIQISLAAGILDNGVPPNYSNVDYNVKKSSYDNVPVSAALSIGGVLASQISTWQELGIEFGYRLPRYYLLNAADIVDFRVTYATLFANFGGYVTHNVYYKVGGGLTLIEDSFGHNANGNTLASARTEIGLDLGHKTQLGVRLTYVPGSNLNTPDPLHNCTTYNMTNLAITYTMYL